MPNILKLIPLVLALALGGCLSGGGSGTAPVAQQPAPLPTLTALEYLYMANTQDNSITAYRIGPDGALAPIPGIGSGGVNYPTDVAADPQGHHLYVLNTDAGNNPVISVFAIDKSTGALSAQGAPLGVPGPASEIVVAPNGQFAYVANSTGNAITQLRIDPSTGALSLNPAGTSAAAPGEVDYLAITPGSQFLYAVNQNGNLLYTYAINSTSGALTSVNAGVATGRVPFNPLIAPSGKILYVPNQIDDSISQFAINPTDGTLSPVAGAASFSTGPATQPVALAINPNGANLYTANFAMDEAASFDIDPHSGALSMPSGYNVVGTAHDPDEILVEPSGLFAYSLGIDQVTMRTVIDGYRIDPASGLLIDNTAQPPLTQYHGVGIVVKPL